MSEYTTQLRYIIASGVEIFDFDYPIFDESYREVLEEKILDTYFFREIGFDTVAQFKHFLKNRLRIIMPYYNEHYLQYKAFLSLDPYVNKDLTTTDKRTLKQDRQNKSDSKMTGQSTATGDTNFQDNEVFSDTPQSRLLNKDYATNLTDHSGTNHTEQESSDQTSGVANQNEKFTGTDEYVSNIKGFDGMKYASDVYKDIRAVLINVDQMVIDELNDLFMNIY